jgi:hypothetical protein
LITEIITSNTAKRRQPKFKHLIMITLKKIASNNKKKMVTSKFKKHKIRIKITASKK